MQSNKTQKAHIGLKKIELVFIILAVFAVAFTLGIFYRKSVSGASLKMESLAAQTATVSPKSSGQAVYMKKININTASAEELTDLPEIGEVLAGRIIEYRKANGTFKKVDDIMKVGGIGEKIFDKIKDLISVE